MSFGTLPDSQYTSRLTAFHAVPLHCNSSVTCVVRPFDEIVGALYARFPAHWNGPDFTIFSLVSSAACAPARIWASVHAACAEPAGGPVAGAGAATLRQFGLPVAAACASRPDVSTPMMPSTARPAAVWTQRTAWIVFGPSVPSTVPALQPSALSWRCSTSVPAASLVLDVVAAPATAAGSTAAPRLPTA